VAPALAALPGPMAAIPAFVFKLHDVVSGYTVFDITA
jgi:hypothetical protein